MKICPKCGEHNEDSAGVCTKCGEKLSDVQSSQDAIHTGNTAQNDGQSSSVFSFIDEDEVLIADLAAGYMKNIITHKALFTSYAALTQKRLYISGKTYLLTGVMVKSMLESKIVNVEEITGTGFVRTKNLLLLFVAVVISLLAMLALLADEYEGIPIPLLLAAAAVAIAVFIASCKSLFRIEYSGGSMGFKIKWSNKKAAEDFQKEIIRTKEKRKRELSGH